MVQLWVLVVSVVAAIVVAGAAGCGIGFAIRKSIGGKKIGSAEQEAARIVEEGKKNAEAKKKELLLEGKEEGLRLRNETERDLKERRTEISRQERRLVQKEENLDKKTEALERKNEQLDEKLKANDIVKEQIQMVLTQHLSRLEEISGYTAETCYNKIWSTNQARSDWKPVRDEVSAGDYVIIAYLHNDYCAVADPSKNNGLYQSTEYINVYRGYIEAIADECEEIGAQLILVVPPNTGSTTNFHNRPVNGVDVGDYSAVFPAIAEERGLPCVSIHKWTLEEANKDASFLDTIYLTKNYLYDLIAKGEFTEEALNNHSNKGLAKNHYDHTHLSILGCKNVAEYVASQLKNMNTGIEKFLK